MAWFCRKSVEVVRRGVVDKELEELTTRGVGRETVEVRRVRAAPEKKRAAKPHGRDRKPRTPTRDNRGRSTRQFDDEIIFH